MITFVDQNGKKAMKVLFKYAFDIQWFYFSKN